MHYLLYVPLTGYEGVFERRAFGGELEEDEFVQFFRECDLMPANHEIEHAMDLVFKGNRKQPINIQLYL